LLVLDVESSGLDVRRDRLLAIAAVAVRTDGARPAIDLGDSFELVLRQPEAESPPDKANILLHGIGVGSQRAGQDRVTALQAFARFAGTSPLLAFHAAFDRGMIERALRAEQLPPLPNPWLDIEPLAAVLHPQVLARSLDEWMAHFDIRCPVRHQAAADTLATAELLLRLWPALRAELKPPGFAATAALAAQRRWLQR
jgi:DNA polymerase III subunit epsilon